MTTNKKFETGLDDKFEDALAMLAAGIPMDIIMAEAGQEADQLRPLLKMVGEISTLKQTMPIPPPQASLHKMLAHAEKLAVSLPPSHTQPAWQINFLSLFKGGFRLAAGLTTALMVFVLVGSMLSLAAQRSLPGDTLYRLKQARETLQLNLTSDPDRREALSETFNQRRRMEIEALLAQGNVATVGFEENIQAVTVSTIKISDLTVETTPETKITGQLAVGARVRIEVLTRPPAGLLALTIMVLEPGSPPAPSPTPSPTSTPTATLPKVQATDTLPKLQPTATVPPAQTNDTIELTPTPTATDIPAIDIDDSDDNLNENDDFEDNINNNGDNGSDDDLDDDDFNDNGDNDSDDDFDDDDFNDNGDNGSDDDFDDDDFDDNGLDNDDFDDDEFDDDNSNDNDGDSNSNDDDDRSGRGNGSDESNDNQDDSDDDEDNSGRGSSDGN